MSLASWQCRLDSHFEQLCRKRTAPAVPRPLFGLEHGLNALELDQLKEDVRTHIAKSPPSREHPLPWMVYACEMGYRYAGDEYWQTFEERTAGWEVNGSRDWIRSCFRRFHDRFGGARPTGKWAEQFSIICWPITHAILPKDLQRQLARILYDARHAFTAEHFESPEALGNLIAARGWNATSRFRQLAQEPVLVGQIAAALLLPEERESNRLILSTTLLRICTDLDRERLARDWLRGAQRLAQQRIQLRGLAIGQTLRQTQRTQDTDVTERARQLGIEPRVVLRPAGEASWDAYLEIPDLTHIMIKFPKVRQVLTGSRCVVAGSTRRPIARCGFLHGARQVRLQEWPSPGNALLSFERSTPELDALLDTECLLRPGDVWLFRVASDGLAYEVRGRNVRPGQRYVLISTGQPFPKGSVGVPATVSCAGISAADLSLDNALNLETTEYLQQFGISQSRSVDVWPAGLAASRWDGEGAADWLSSEAPCIGIRSDYDVESFGLVLDNDANTWTEVRPTSTGQALFIELPELPLGPHELGIKTKARGDDGLDATGHLQILVREPTPWEPGFGSQGAILIVADPTTPSMEDMWEGKATVEIHGPPSRRVRCSVVLFERRKDEPFLQRTLPPLGLPATGPEWRDYFEQHFRRVRDCQNGYDLAQSLAIRFDGEELGAFTLTCEREFTPLRWVVRHSSQGYRIRLLDDVDAADEASLKRYDFTDPERGLELDAREFRRFRTKADPGLYVAESGGHRRAVVIPPLAVKTFSDMRICPQIQVRDRSPRRVGELLNAISIWGNSQLPGDLFSRMMRRQVVSALLHKVHELFGGARWGRVEQRFTERERPQDDAALAELRWEISKKYETGLGASLLEKLPEFVDAPVPQRVVDFSSTVARFLQLPTSASPSIHRSGGSSVIQGSSRVQDPVWLSEFALRLASDPESAAAWAGDHLEAAVGSLFELPTLARAARFLVLTVASRTPRADVNEDLLVPGWEWV